MVNPGAFSGSRKEFLCSLKDYYAKAVNDGDAAEAISTIQRRYFIRYPIELPHDVEPSAEHLASVDDDAAVPEPEGPNPDLLTVDEYEAALLKWNERQKSVLFRKAQIKRWFAYQYMKDMDLDATQTGSFNPYRAVVSKLTGKKINPPRQRSAANVWRKTQRDAVEAEVQSRLQAFKDANDEDVKKEKLLAFRDEVARSMFQALTEEEQRNWRLAAIAEHQQAMKQWKIELDAKPATDPKSRQIAIQGLVQFLQPIMDMLCKATGWKASFICGGPEPALGGLLNVVSLHSGATSGDVKMSFGQSERAQFRKAVVPLYGQFLQKCFTPDECRSRALAKDEGFLPLAELDLDNEGASVDPVLPPSSQPPPIRLGPPYVAPQRGPTPGPNGSKAPHAGRAASAPTPFTTSGPAQQKAPGRQLPPTTSVAQRSVAAAPARSPVSTSTITPSASQTPATAVVPTLPAPASTPAVAAAQSASSTTVTPAPSAPAATPAAVAAEPLLTTTTAPTPPAPASMPQPPPPTTTAPAAAPSSALPVQVGYQPKEPRDLIPEENPFPFDLDVPLSPQTTRQGAAVSRNPTPLPSPLPSPRASPSPGDQPLPPPSTEASHPAESDGLGSSNKTTITRRSQREPKHRAEKGEKGRKKRPVDALETNHNPSTVGPSSKRARTSRAATKETGAFEVPNDAPDWFKKAFGMLMSEDFGEEWKRAVELWGQFESAAGYVGTSKVGAAKRPEAVKDWIQRARSSTWRPLIRNPASFGSDLKVWWEGIQPEWRVQGDGQRSTISKGSWDAIRRPGVNGLLSVAAALFFWGNALKKTRQETGQWLEVVNDFHFVLSCLMTSA